MNAVTTAESLASVEQRALLRLRLEAAGRLMHEAKKALDRGEPDVTHQILSSLAAIDCMVWAGAIEPPRPAIICPAVPVPLFKT